MSRYEQHPNGSHIHSVCLERVSMHHILIVEDEPIIRSALRRLLERNQYQISEAGSVQEAQERYNIHSFDLIISDLRLPGAPGTEMIKLAEPKPVLIMTSYASLRSAVDSMRLGAIDYIAKPFGIMELISRVKALLRRPSKEQTEKTIILGDQSTGKTSIITRFITNKFSEGTGVLI